VPQEPRRACSLGARAARQVLDGAVAAAAQHMDMLHRVVDSIALLDMLAAFATAVASMDVKCASLGHRDPNPNLCLPPVRERTAPVAAAGTCARASARPGRWPSWLGATRCWSRRSRASPSRPTTPTSAVRGAACKRPAPCLATAS